MRRKKLHRIAGLILLVPPAISGWAQDGKNEDGEEGKPDSNIAFQSDFEGAEPGSVPSDFLEIDGSWSIEERDGEGGKAMKLAADPLVEASVQFGKSLKSGGTIVARILTERKRRSLPRFGVGLHGISGFKLRMVPVQGKLELVKGGVDDAVQQVDCEWRAGEWYFFELTVKEAGDAWTVTGRAWAESDDRPKQAQIDYIATDVRLSGKGSVMGTPYAGLPIWYDDIEVKMSPAPPEEEKK